MNPNNWPERSLRAVWHPCTQMQQAESVPPFFVERAEGPWLMGATGERVFDAISSWWVILFGHGDPQVRAAIEDQLGRLPHTLLAGCTHQPAVELAERLSARTGGQLGHAFYASDGASAIEIALKMSHHAWVNRGRPQKRGFVCLQRSYHGETLGALAVTDVAVFRNAYQRLLMPCLLMPSPAPEGPEPPGEAACRSLRAIEALLHEQADEIAAIVVEPMVQAAGGMALHDPGFLKGLRALCDTHEVHLIFDEIAVGCGRTGRFFACEHAGVWPDLLTLSKGITGGMLPLSIVLSAESVYRAFLDDEVARGFLHSHSYSGNPLACRAALAVLDRFDHEDVFSVQAQSAARLDQALAGFSADPRLENSRRLGMIWAWDLAEGLDAAGFPLAMRRAGLQQGLLVRPIGKTLYLMPPFGLTPEGISEEEAAWLAQALASSFDVALQGGADERQPEPASA